MDQGKKVLSLVNKIDSGNITYDAVVRQINLIEDKYGKLDMLYEVKDISNPSYYDELLSDARLGIYNRESLLKMAELKPGRNSKRTIKHAMIIGGILIAVVVAIFVAVKVGRQS